MKKLIKLSLGLIAATAMFGSCNSDYSEAETTTASVAVYSFSLQADANVLANLDTVFFSIDLVNAQIFNADSLPYGTRINKLVPRITVLDGVSAAELTVHRANGTDTIHNYLTSTTDSIDFSNGPVDLRIVSADGLLERTYSIQVNVHTLVTDSLVWDKTALRELPSLFSAPAAQHTTRNNEGIYCLTTDGSAYSLASTANPYDNDWETASVTLPAGAIAESFTGAGDALYILADDGASVNNYALYASTDQGATWAATGSRMTHIYGNCSTTLVGNIHTDSGEWLSATETGNGPAMPAGAPVSKTSNSISYNFPMAENDQMLVIGGRDADGNSVRAAWAFDGSSWAKISTFTLPWACDEMILVPFMSFTESETFVVTEYATILAFGGISDNQTQRTVYASTTYGLGWSEASELMQLPENVPAAYGAQAFVADATLYPTSRATRPIEEWECPFFYVFGGKNASGTTYNTMWRATFNRLKFKPIQ